MSRYKTSDPEADAARYNDDQCESTDHGERCYAVAEGNVKEARELLLTKFSQTLVDLMLPDNGDATCAVCEYLEESIPLKTRQGREEP